MVLWARTVPIMKNVLGMHVHVILHILSSRLLGNSRKKVSSIYVSKVTLLVDCTCNLHTLSCLIEDTL